PRARPARRAHRVPPRPRGVEPRLARGAPRLRALRRLGRARDLRAAPRRRRGAGAPPPLPGEPAERAAAQRAELGVRGDPPPPPRCAMIARRIAARLRDRWRAWVALCAEEERPTVLAVVRIGVAAVLLADFLSAERHGLVATLWGPSSAGGLSGVDLFDP